MRVVVSGGVLASVLVHCGGVVRLGCGEVDILWLVDRDDLSP